MSMPPRSLGRAPYAPCIAAATAALALVTFAPAAHAADSTVEVPGERASEVTASPASSPLATSTPGAERRDDPHPWYGWEYAAADVSGVALVLVARAERPSPLLRGITSSDGWHHPVGAVWTTDESIGTALYLGGAPLTHALNGHPVNAFASFGARLLPLALVQITEPVGAGVGFFIRDSHGQRAHCGGGWVCIDPAQGSHADDGSRVGADVGLFAGMVGAIAIDQLALSRESVGGRPSTARPPGSTATRWSPDVRIGKDAAYAGVGGRF